MGADDMHDRVVDELGHGLVDGDPEVVRTYASTCSGIATVVNQLLPNLQVVSRSAQDGQSEAVVELCLLAERVTSRLGKVQERYGTMGTSLAVYAEVLDAVCAQSDQAYSDGRTALTDLDLHKSQLVRLKDERQVGFRPDDPLGGVGLALSLHQRSGLRYDAHDASQVAKVGLIDADYVLLDAARGSIGSAWETLESAAGTVVATLKGLHDDGLDDGVKENMSKVGSTLHLDDLHAWANDHLDNITTLLGVAALVTCWIPVVGEIFMIAAAVASMALLVTSVVNLCQDGATSEEWQAAGWAALGVVTLGVGRVAGKGIELAGRTSAAPRAGANVGSKTAGDVAGSGAKSAKAADPARPSGSTARELSSSLDPRSMVQDSAERMRSQAQNPSIKTTFNGSHPFARSAYTDAQWDSAWRPVAQANWVGDKALLARNVTVMVDGGTSGGAGLVGCPVPTEPQASPVIFAPPESVNTDFQDVVPNFGTGR